MNVRSAAFAASGDGRRALSFSSAKDVLRADTGVLITLTSATRWSPSDSNSDASVNSERSPSPSLPREEDMFATFLPRAGDRGDHADATCVARAAGMFRGKPLWSMLGRAGELLGFFGGAPCVRSLRSCLTSSLVMETGGRRLACDPGRDPGRDPARPREEGTAFCEFCDSKSSAR